MKINYNGEPDYKPFAVKYQQCGAQLVYYNLTPGPILENFLTTMSQLGEHPVYVTEAADYTEPFAEWNTQGIANQTYTREAFEPIENADIVPAVKQYVDAVKAIGGSTDQLGEQATSAFLLWATEAKSCGSNLTRQCMVNALSQVHYLDRRGAARTHRPGRQQALGLRPHHEAHGHHVVAVLPDHPRPVRLQPRVPLQHQLGRLGHDPRSGPDRHQVPHPATSSNRRPDHGMSKTASQPGATTTGCSARIRGSHRKFRGRVRPWGRPVSGPVASSGAG